MKTFLLPLAVAVACMALMMAGLGVKILCRRSRSFQRPCANADPTSGHCTHCTCGKSNDDAKMDCKNKNNTCKKNDNL